MLNNHDQRRLLEKWAAILYKMVSMFLIPNYKRGREWQDMKSVQSIK